MPTIDWGDLRAKAVDEFGDAPGVKLEQRITTVFQDHPDLVERILGEISRRYAQGLVYTPWPAFAAAVEREAKRVQDAHLITASQPDQEQAVLRAKAFIRRAGHDYRTRRQIVLELFGAPDLTADTETLELLCDELPKVPGGKLLLPALKAQLERTRKHGRQEVPGNPKAILYAFDTPELRDEIVDYWRQTTW